MCHRIIHNITTAIFCEWTQRRWMMLPIQILNKYIWNEVVEKKSKTFDQYVKKGRKGFRKILKKLNIKICICKKIK